MNYIKNYKNYYPKEHIIYCLKRHLIYGLFAFILIAWTCNYAKAKDQKKTTNKDEKTKPEVIMDCLSPGWNLGNSFDSIGGELSLGNQPTTKEMIASVKKQGFRSIRIPITWVGHFEESSTSYQIDESYLKRIDDVIGYALEENLYVIINLQHDSWKWINQMGVDDTVLQQYTAIWQQLALHYKDYSNQLLFEAVNEPSFDHKTEKEQYQLLDTLLCTFYNTVRTSGGYNSTRMLLFPTLNSNNSKASCKALYKTMKSFKDDNISATFHYYGSWDFSVNAGGKTTFDKEVKSDIKEAFDVVHKQFIKKNIPVICTEYSLYALEDGSQAIRHGEVLKYFEYINYYAKNKKIPLMLWDNGGLFERNQLSWSDEDLYQMIKTSWKKRSSYASSDRIYVEDVEKIKTKKFQLTLNGNKFLDVYNGEQKLILGQDYTYKDKKLKIKGDYIKSVITGQLGINTTLTVKFSKGQDFKISIICCNTPILSPAKGNMDGLVIPTTFLGDELLTMQAINVADKKNTGPLEYTAYKEFGYTFSPNYQENTITLTKDFLQAINEGETLLVFGFCSGKKVEYTIIKDQELIQAKNYEEYEAMMQLQRDNELRELERKEIEREQRRVLQSGILKIVIPKTKEVHDKTEMNAMTNQERLFVASIILLIGVGGSSYFFRGKTKFTEFKKDF